MIPLLPLVFCEIRPLVAPPVNQEVGWLEPTRPVSRCGDARGGDATRRAWGREPASYSDRNIGLFPTTPRGWVGTFLASSEAQLTPRPARQILANIPSLA